MSANPVTMMGSGKSLAEKLCEIALSQIWIEKTGRVGGGGDSNVSYKYATEADLVTALRNEIYSRKIFLTPRILEMRNETVLKNEKKTDREGKVTEYQKASYITNLIIEWTWRDGETGETMITSMAGGCVDTSDKGVYKAITGSEKYLLLKTFLIPTFDDPEKMQASDKRALQQRIAVEKVASMKATKDAKGKTGAEAQAILKKGEVLFISMPEAFEGDYIAVSGSPIADPTMIQLFSDVAANRFKNPSVGVYYKVEVAYKRDVIALAEKIGYTVDTHEIDKDSTNE